MNLKYCLNSVYNCLPLSRLKLLEDVILYRSCGPIHDIWLNNGHIFVCLDGGRKLVTFDCKTADLIQDVETDGCLDLSLKCPILTIVSWPPIGVLIVQQNGEVQHWVFGQDYKWKKQNGFYICKSVGATVTSACLNIAQHSLYWCERTQRDGRESFTLYKRPIKEDDASRHCLSLGSITSLIKNCCDGKIHPMGHGIVYTPSSSSMKLSLVFCTLTGSVEVITDGGRVKLSDINTHTPVTYGQVVLASMAQLQKQKDQPYVIKTCYNTSSQTLLLLYSDGKVSSITATPETDRQPVYIQHNDVPFTDVTSVIPLQQCIGLVFKSEIRVYSLKTGVHVCDLSCDDQVDIEGSCESMFGNQQSGVYTVNSLYLIQRERSQGRIDDQTLIKTGHFQSQAIQLSYLEKMQKASYDANSVQTLEQLKTTWENSLGSNPTSKLTEIVDPYLSEYWKLENMLEDRCEYPNMIGEMDTSSVGHEVDRLLDPKTKISNSSRQTQLLLLSQWHPNAVLDSLLERFDLRDNELSTSQTHKWQCILAAETANLAGSCDIPVPLFELITHLLYKYKPDMLTKFLHRSQTVWDKKLGMSAFIRRRQSLLIYERALKCIPEPEISNDKETAILVHVHILLKSETDGCFLKAVRMLLKYKKWSEVIELYRENKENQKQAVLVYQMIILALTQFQVLHKYADAIFPLMPSINCTDVIQFEGSDGASPDVLCSENSSSCISMKTVKPYLLKCIKETLNQSSE